MPGPAQGWGNTQYADPRMVAEIMRNPQNLQEQGPGFMQDWGGPQAYIDWGRVDPEIRMVYFANKAGYSNSNDIEAATGLSSREVSRGIAYLEKNGYVMPGAIVSSSGM